MIEGCLNLHDQVKLGIYDVRRNIFKEDLYRPHTAYVGTDSRNSFKGIIKLLISIVNIIQGWNPSTEIDKMQKRKVFEEEYIHHNYFQ